MLVIASMHERYLSNSYLVADADGGSAVIIDAGAPMEPLLAAIDEHGLTITHLFNTHEHHDHTVHNVDWQERFDVPLLTADDMAHGQVIDTGDLHIRALSTPGHTTEHFSLCVNNEAVFTGDVLFAGSVGGTMNGGPDGCASLRHSIMEELMRLDHEMVVWPGHTASTTIGTEWETNPFIRLWRGLDDPTDEPVEVAGHQATMLLWAGDYDGTNKALVRFADGREAVVGGSMVSRGARAGAGR